MNLLCINLILLVLVNVLAYTHSLVFLAVSTTNSNSKSTKKNFLQRLISKINPNAYKNESFNDQVNRNLCIDTIINLGCHQINVPSLNLCRNQQVSIFNHIIYK